LVDILWLELLSIQGLSDDLGFAGVGDGRCFAGQQNGFQAGDGFAVDAAAVGLGRRFQL